jgi:hypothetical protein
MDAVAARLLAQFTPDQITVALAAADEVTTRHTRSHRAAELAVERARYEADRAERAFTAVDPGNRLVAQTLESRWEARLTALAEAEAALTAVREPRPSLPDRDGLLALATDLPRLWHADDTREKDRKRLLRTLVSDVTLLLPETDRWRARVGLRWHTGASEEVALERPKPAPEARRTPSAALALISRLGPQLRDAEIVTELAAAGITTGSGHPFDEAAVHWVRHVHKIPSPFTVPFRDGEISVKEVAHHLGIAADAVYYWITHGRWPPARLPAAAGASPGTKRPRPHACGASPNPGTSP